MNKFSKPLIVMMAALALAACASSSQRTAGPPAETEAPDTGRDTGVVVGTGNRDTTDDPFAGVDPTNYADERNLRNPASALSRRVVYFDFDQSSIRAEYREVVSAHAAHLSAYPNKRVVLEGHADERGTREYNLGLGERRGNGVGRAMSAGGASGGQSEVVSYGEERPVMTCSDDGCWSQNRRVEIVYR